VALQWCNKTIRRQEEVGKSTNYKRKNNMKDIIHGRKIQRQFIGAFAKPLMISLTVCVFVVIVISCSKQDKGSNPVSDQGASLGKAVGPTISSISPASAEIGDLLTINGNNFGPKQQTGYFVTIKGIRATVYQSWSQTQIKVFVNPGSTGGSGKVSVTTGSKTSNEVNFTLVQYTPVTIGTQTWMGYNLDVSKYNNGDDIPQVTDATAWDNLTTGAWCYYNNDPAMGALYGKLYNWYAVNDSRGLAPVGWHIPSDAEWKTLSMYLGMSQIDADLFGKAYFGTTEGGKMKKAGTSLWVSPNTGATNLSGFLALPGGMRSALSNYDFAGPGLSNFWWSSTEFDAATAWMRGVENASSGTYRYYLTKKHGFSVRCIQDN
jgi:uncharacterized protein (TIGR02145 family)